MSDPVYDSSGKVKQKPTPEPFLMKLQVWAFLAAAVGVLLLIGIAYLILNIKIKAEKILCKEQ